MNIAIGCIAMLSVFFYMFDSSNSSSSAYLTNINGIILVLGGTFVIYIYSTPLKIALKALTSLIKFILFSKSDKSLKLELLKVSESRDNGENPDKSFHPLIAKGHEWIEIGIKGAELDALIEDSINAEIQEFGIQTQSLLNMTKYPPALGMIGTVWGIIEVFNQMGIDTSNAEASLGAGLALAMSTTLYGLILSNFFISPISEFFQYHTDKKEKQLYMIAKCIKHWEEKKGLIFIEEHMGSICEAS